MHLVRMHLGTQGGIHALVSCNGALALKFRRHNRRCPVAAITSQLTQVTGQMGHDDGSQLFSSHVNTKWGDANASVANFVARAQQMHSQGADGHKSRSNDTQTDPWRYVTHTKKTIPETINHVEKRVEVADRLPKRRQ